MADVHSKEIRSKNMAAIKGKDTKPEMLIRRFYMQMIFLYKLHDKTLPANFAWGNCFLVIGGY